jgi:hypothetical protein
LKKIKLKKRMTTWPYVAGDFIIVYVRKVNGFWAFFLALKARNLIGFLIGFLDST